MDKDKGNNITDRTAVEDVTHPSYKVGSGAPPSGGYEAPKKKKINSDQVGSGGYAR